MQCFSLEHFAAVLAFFYYQVWRHLSTCTRSTDEVHSFVTSRWTHLGAHRRSNDFPYTHVCELRHWYARVRRSWSRVEGDEDRNETEKIIKNRNQRYPFLKNSKAKDWCRLSMSKSKCFSLMTNNHLKNVLCTKQRIYVCEVTSFCNVIVRYCASEVLCTHLWTIKRLKKMTKAKRILKIESSVFNNYFWKNRSLWHGRMGDFNRKCL